MIRRKVGFRQSGVTLVFGVVLATSMVILLLALSKLVRQVSHEAVYMNSIRDAFRIAESGLNDIVGKIVLDPLLVNSSTAWYVEPEVSLSSKEKYQNSAIRRDTAMVGGYYIVSSASLTVSGKTYGVRLHSHVQISNVGEYMFAVTDVLSIGENTNAPLAKAYAPTINFDDSNSTEHITLQDAHYVNNFMVSGTPFTSLSPLQRSQIIINGGAQPTKLTYPILFPQILESDVQRYMEIAHTTDTIPANWKHEKCVWGPGSVIYPPGYADGQITPSDTYTNHTDDNKDHVYYCHNDMYIEGTVVGQVLFVSTNTIYISSGLFKAAGTVPFPGNGNTAIHVGSSTAHQAILITRGNVVIANTFYGPTPPYPQKVQTIEAYILAPHASLVAQTYTDTFIHGNLSLLFNGSMVLGSSPSMDIVFQGAGQRVYTYDTSLKFNKPPYIPAVADVHYSFEEVVSAPGIYD